MSHVHGTPSAYERHGCRCDLCRETHNARIRRSRAARLAAGRINHGSAAGWDDGCRCTTCRDAHQERHYTYANRKRADVARCTHCVKHHDRGHVCTKCGAAPNHALTLPDDGVIDEVAIERAMQGEPVKLTTREREHAVRLMAAKGRNATQIATTLRMNGSRVNAVLGVTA